MISILLAKRFWLIKQRIFSTLGVLLLLPVFLYVVANLPISKMVVKPLWNVPQEQWIFPGLVIIVLVIMLIPSIYREFFSLRIHNKLFPSLSLTPVSKPLYMFNFLIAIIIESALYTILIMGIYSTIMIPGFNILNYVIMYPFILLFVALTANLFITISLLVNRSNLYDIFVLALFIFIMFATGLIIEFEYFPEVIGTVLRYLPTGQIMQSLRMVLFSGVANWLPISIIVLIIILWTYINGLLFKIKLEK